MAEQRSGRLLIDWGGVLTTNLFASFYAYCVQAEIDPQMLVGRFKADPECARAADRAGEGPARRRPRSSCASPSCWASSPKGLIDGLFAGVRPDDGDGRRGAPGARGGHRAPRSCRNSWGIHRYPHELFEELFDGVVISGEEGIRKPSRRMYELGAERAGVPAAACVYVDDLPFNLTPARGAGHGHRAPHERRDDDPRARTAAGSRAGLTVGAAEAASPDTDIAAHAGPAHAGPLKAGPAASGLLVALPRPYRNLNRPASSREVRRL